MELPEDQSSKTQNNTNIVFYLWSYKDRRSNLDQIMELPEDQSSKSQLLLEIRRKTLKFEGLSPFTTIYHTLIITTLIIFQDIIPHTNKVGGDDGSSL